MAGPTMGAVPRASRPRLPSPLARAAATVPAPARRLAPPAVLSLFALLALLARTDLKSRGTAAFADPGWDRHLYIEMASHNPLDFHLAPFCWRVLVPLVAKALPGGLQTGFFVITFLSLWVAGALLFALLRREAPGTAVAAAGVLTFFSLGWGAKFALADFWIPDAAVLALTTAAILLAQSRRDRWLALCLLAGAATKESVLFAIPLVYTLRAAHALDRQAAVRTLLVAAPALVLAVVLRLAIPAWNTDAAYVATLPADISRFPELFPNYSYWSLAQDIGYDLRVREFGLDSFWSYTTRPFGAVLPLLALFGVWRKPRLALRLSPFLLLVYAQLAFATDTERLLVLAAPALLWLAAAGAATLRPRPAFAPAAIVLGSGLFLAGLLEADGYGLPLELQAAAVLAAGVTFLALPLVERSATQE